MSSLTDQSGFSLLRFRNNVFLKWGGVVSPTPNPQQSWRTDVFLLVLSPLADQPWFKRQRLALRPYMSLPSKTLPRGHDVDMHVWDLVGMYGISWVLSVHSCQQAMHPQGHILPLWPPLCYNSSINLHVDPTVCSSPTLCMQCNFLWCQGLQYFFANNNCHKQLPCTLVIYTQNPGFF